MITEPKLPGIPGAHGWSHWNRVNENGQTIGRINGADLDVVKLFAFIHDSMRENNSHDPEHGKRAAEWAANMNNESKLLSEKRMNKLVYALFNHDKGMTIEDVTVGTCWDADRLDLPRVGIAPDPAYMSTEIGKYLAEVIRGEESST